MYRRMWWNIFMCWAGQWSSTMIMTSSGQRLTWTVWWAAYLISFTLSFLQKSVLYTQVDVAYSPKPSYWSFLPSLISNLSWFYYLIPNVICYVCYFIMSVIISCHPIPATQYSWGKFFRSPQKSCIHPNAVAHVFLQFRVHSFSFRYILVLFRNSDLCEVFNLIKVLIECLVDFQSKATGIQV